MSPERITDLRQISDKVLVDLKTWLEPWFEAVRGGGVISGTTRLTYGEIYNDGGTDDPGSGDWEVQWSGAGAGNPGFPATNVYTFTVTPDFNAAITVVLLTATCNNSASGVNPSPYFVVLNRSESQTNSFVVYTYDADGTPTDGSFSFLCVEDPAP